MGNCDRNCGQRRSCSGTLNSITRMQTERGFFSKLSFWFDLIGGVVWEWESGAVDIHFNWMSSALNTHSWPSPLFAELAATHSRAKVKWNKWKAEWPVKKRGKGVPAKWFDTLRGSNVSWNRAHRERIGRQTDGFTCQLLLSSLINFIRD